MSRSYKKTPWCGDRKGKTKKRIANHIVRQSLKRDLELIAQGGDYKKLYCSWDICDYGSVYTWKEYWKSSVDTYYWLQARYPNWERKFPDEKEEYRKWRRYYKNK